MSEDYVNKAESPVLMIDIEEKGEIKGVSFGRNYDDIICEHSFIGWFTQQKWSGLINGFLSH